MKVARFDFQLERTPGRERFATFKAGDPVPDFVADRLPGWVRDADEDDE